MPTPLLTPLLPARTLLTASKPPPGPSIAAPRHGSSSHLPAQLGGLRPAAAGDPGMAAGSHPCRRLSGTQASCVPRRASPRGSVPARASNCPHRAAGLQACSFPARPSLLPLRLQPPSASEKGEPTDFNELPGGIAPHPHPPAFPPLPAPGNRCSETQPSVASLEKNHRAHFPPPFSFPPRLPQLFCSPADAKDPAGLLCFHSQLQLPIFAVSPCA